MLWCQFIASDGPCVRFRITGVKVHSMPAGNQGQRELEVGAQLICRTSPAGIAASDGQSAANLLPQVLEATDVISLPAVQRNGNAGQSPASCVAIDTQLGVTLSCQFI